MTVWGLIVAIALVLPSFADAAGGGNCLMCHGNDAVMKLMVRPPVIGGEGEG
jgi:mono/diheme cytochrome c family protein